MLGPGLEKGLGTKITLVLISGAKSDRKMMTNPVSFIEEVREFNANVIPEQTIANTDRLISLPFFNYETMKTKSFAAANLANWVVNCVKYHKIYLRVAPLMAKVEAQEEEEAQKEKVL